MRAGFDPLTSGKAFAFSELRTELWDRSIPHRATVGIKQEGRHKVLHQRKVPLLLLLLGTH